MPWCPECGAEFGDQFTQCSRCGVALVDRPPAGVKRPARPEPEWVETARYQTTEEAHLAQGLLRERGIASEVVDRHVVLNPFPQVDEAEVLLLVAPGDRERAGAVLAEAEAGEDTLPDEADTEQGDI